MCSLQLRINKKPQQYALLHYSHKTWKLKKVFCFCKVLEGYLFEIASLVKWKIMRSQYKVEKKRLHDDKPVA